jgi:hypothetical protein
MIGGWIWVIHQIRTASKEEKGQKTGVMMLMIGAGQGELKPRLNRDVKKSKDVRNSPFKVRIWIGGRYCAGHRVCRSSIDNDAANAFAPVHVVKCFVDVVQRHRKRDKFVQLNFARHILINHTRQF